MRQSQLVKRVERLELPECIQECIWFEADDNEDYCRNRRTFVCYKHRDDIFGSVNPGRKGRK